MIAALALALAGIAPAGGAPAIRERPAVVRRCTANRALLIGAWHDPAVSPQPSDVFPGGDSYEMQFVVERGRQVFREYLHFRPGNTGLWRLNGCRLTVADRDWHVAYDIVRMTRTGLWLREVGERETLRLERITARR